MLRPMYIITQCNLVSCCFTVDLVTYRTLFKCDILQMSPVKRPTSVKTPARKEGRPVVAADSSHLLLAGADEDYTVVDCESSVTALDMVQLRLDKQGG